MYVPAGKCTLVPTFKKIIIFILGYWLPNAVSMSSEKSTQNLHSPAKIQTRHFLVLRQTPWPLGNRMPGSRLSGICWGGYLKIYSGEVSFTKWATIFRFCFVADIMSMLIMFRNGFRNNSIVQRHFVFLGRLTKTNERFTSSCSWKCGACFFSGWLPQFTEAQPWELAHDKASSHSSTHFENGKNPEKAGPAPE